MTADTGSRTSKSGGPGRHGGSGGPVRRLPQGAEVQPGGGVHFRLWAPDRDRVTLVLEDGPAIDLDAAGGWFEGLVPEAAAGSRYRYRLDGDETLLPDPASRFQPEGVHGWSEVVDPGSFRWSDDGWRGVERRGLVLYEMHIGTFTGPGTWEAAIEQLPALVDTGITCIEVMPVAEFAGRFGWGYDGVDLYAPTRLYGRPDDMRRFVDAAHVLGLGVILDVVYNHLGPDGNYLARFARGYFTDRYENEWGQPLNFDGTPEDDGDSGPVRDFFAANTAYWIDEFHLDGLRLDATQQMFDAGHPHIIAEIVRAARAAAPGRRLFIVGENEPQDCALLKPEDEGGCDLDALWNDDFHHTAIVALTGRREAYYTDYRGTPQELVSAARHGFLYQGQYYVWQDQRRGSPCLGLPGEALVSYLQNHDQIANSARGWRIDRLAGQGRVRALTAYMLLIPATPMLFQGQEFRAGTPFHYFADHEPELAGAVSRGRLEFLSQFQSIAHSDVKEDIPEPHDPATFAACKLDHDERERNAEWVRLHRDLLRLRREDPTFRRQDAGRLEGAVLGAESFVLRFRGERPGEDRLLIVNLGNDQELRPAPEPLLAPPSPAGWRILWSSEDATYGGLGQPPVEQEDGWYLPARAAIVLVPQDGAADRTANADAVER